MTLQVTFTLFVLVAMAYLFLSELLAIEITAFLTLLVFFAAGMLSSEEVFAGFSSPAVITILSGFFVSAALHHTGVANALGGRMQALAGSREVLLISLVMLGTAMLSAVMPNVAAAAVMMPTVTSLARRTGVPASRLFMPLAFGAVLGGTLTQVGTPPNLVASEALSASGLDSFTLFSFSYYGLALLSAGVLIMCTVARRWLPAHSPSGPPTGVELMRIYRISERLFSLRVRPGSPLDGTTLRQARLANTLGVQVLAVTRDGVHDLAPVAGTTILGGDVLLVEGVESDLRELLRLRGLQVVDTASPKRLSVLGGLFTGVLLGIGESSVLAGHTVQELRLRERYGCLAVALWRGGERLYDRPGGVRLAEGDMILALGDRTQVEQIAVQPDFEVIEIGPPALRRLEDNVFQLRVGEGSALVGLTVRQSRVGELTGLTIVGRVDGGQLVPLSPEAHLAAGDLLLVSGEQSRVAGLLRFGDIEVDSDVEPPRIDSEDVKTVEAIVAPRSAVAGRTLRQLDFHERYGLRLLALLRGSVAVHEGLADLPLRVGDAMLLQGPTAKMAYLSQRPDFLVLTPGFGDVFRTQRAPIALGAVALMIGLVAADIYPIQIAAFIAAVVVVAFGALTMEQVYEAIDWRTVFVVAAVLPIGAAIEHSGTALWLAGLVTGLAARLGPYGLLVGLMLLSSLLSQLLTGAPAVAILAPVAIVAAERSGVSARPLMMGIALSASVAFLTPFSHRANLLVMGAGGYNTTDYLKVGSLLTVVALAIIATMVALLMPF